MAKKQLLISLEELPITERIIGVSTSLRPYKLSYFLNKDTFFDFFLADEHLDHKVFLSQSKKFISFTTFVHQDVEYGFKIFLIANRSPEGFVLPELMNLDFLIISDQHIHDDYYQQLMQCFKSIQEVSYVVELDTTNLKSKHNLYIDQ